MLNDHRMKSTKRSKVGSESVANEFLSKRRVPRLMRVGTRKKCVSPIVSIEKIVLYGMKVFSEFIPKEI